MHLAARAAQAVALALIVWMTLLQFLLTPAVAAPAAIFTVLLVAWSAAFLLVGARPAVGGAFQALLGLASAFGAVRTHAAGYENWVLAALALVGAGAGLWTAAATRRTGEPAPG